MMKKQSLFTAALQAAVFVLPSAIALNSVAQVQVVESNNRLITPEVRQSQSQPQSAPAAQGGAAEIFYQMQLLQQEVSELRGLVEEQAFEIKRLKQQRLDDYLSIDKRLSALTGGSVNGAATGGGTGQPSVTPQVGGSTAPAATTNGGYTALSKPVTPAMTASNPNESAQYRAAIDLILKKKDYVQAGAALNQYLVDFPKGRFAANSQYWLGELALLGGDLEQARQWFARMVAEWPDHAKVADASYKLGTVYHKLGDAEKAKAVLQEVAAGSSNAARLAKSYLDTNLR